MPLLSPADISPEANPPLALALTAFTSADPLLEKPKDGPICVLSARRCFFSSAPKRDRLLRTPAPKRTLRRLLRFSR